VSSPSASPTESPTLGEASTPATVRSVKTQSQSSASPKSVTGGGSAQLNSAASPAPATTAESAAPVRSLAPKPKRVEEAFYITRTGARYHRSSCHLCVAAPSQSRGPRRRLKDIRRVGCATRSRPGFLSQTRGRR
jgi:hypothetical protein